MHAISTLVLLLSGNVGTWERSANYSARTFLFLLSRRGEITTTNGLGETHSLKPSSNLKIRKVTVERLNFYRNLSAIARKHLSSLISPCSAFNSFTGNKAKLSLRDVRRIFSNLRPTQLIAILLRDFWFRAIARTRKGACTVITRSFARSVDIVAWPVQQRFAYGTKFRKLFND